MAVAEHPVFRNVPNALTLARLAVVPVFVWVFVAESGTSLLAGALFAAAAITDYIDGWYARRFEVETRFGKGVDPIADRLLVNSAAILLSLYDPRVPLLAFSVVLARDVIGVWGWWRLRPYVVPEVTFVGKWGMALMMVGLGGLLLLPAANWPLALFWPGLALSVVAMGEYLWRYRWALPGRQLPRVYSSPPPDEVARPSAAGEESSGSAS